MDARHVGFGLGGRSESSLASERSRRKRPALAIENLESRALLSGVVADIAILPATIQIGPMVVSSDNNLHFVENNGSLHTMMAKVDASGKKTEAPLPSWLEPGTVAGIGADKTGNVWFSVRTPYQGAGYRYRGKVGEITPDGAVHEFNFPTYDDIPGSATMGPDGNFWVAINNVQNGAGVARFVPNGNVTEFMIKGASSVNSLTSGPGGNLWFVDGNKIGKISLQGDVTEYDVPAASGGATDLSNSQLAAGGDGNLWFINAGALNRITPSGDVNAMATPAGHLTSLSVSTNGNLWYSLLPAANGPLGDRPGPVVARLGPQGITTILPDRAGDLAVPVTDIATSPDGSVWFNEGNHTLARISPEVTLPILTQTNRAMGITDTSQVFNGAVASFTSNMLGSKAGDFSAAIDWGDGHISSGSVVANASGGFDVVGANTFNGTPNTIDKATIVVNGPNSTQAVIFGSVQITPPLPATTGPWTTFPPAHPPTPTPTPTPVVTTPPPVVVTPPPVVATPTPVVTAPTPVVTPAPVVTPPATVVATPPPVVQTPVSTPAAPAPASSPSTTTSSPAPTSTTSTTTTSVTSPTGSTGTASSTTPNVNVNVNVNPTLNSTSGMTNPVMTPTETTHWVRGPRGRWVLVHGGATVRNIGAAHPKAPVHKARHHR